MPNIHIDGKAKKPLAYMNYFAALQDF